MSLDSNESGVDTGGPGRELVTLVYEEAYKQIFQGPENCKTFIHDHGKVTEKIIYNFGKFVALAMLHVYGNPRYFSEGLSGFIVGLPECLCSFEDISDYEIKEQLQKIKNCKDESTFNSAVSSFHQRFDLGYNVVKPQFADKDKLIKTISHHCIISSNLEEIQEFTEGLSYNGVLACLKTNPSSAKDLFVYNEKLIDSELVKKMFVARYSNDANLIPVEEDIMYNLHNLIDELGKGNGSVTRDVIPIKNLEDDSSCLEEKNITTGDLLLFLTGSRFVSDEKIYVYFHHGKEGRVTVSTCKLEVFFPVTDRYTGDSFSNMFIDDMVNPLGFGRT